jgi:hypothetical protein
MFQHLQGLLTLATLTPGAMGNLPEGLTRFVPSLSRLA